jgi:hypothetical protein
VEGHYSATTGGDIMLPNTVKRKKGGETKEGGSEEDIK